MSTDDSHPFPPPFDLSTAKAYALSGRIMMSAIIIVFAVVVIMLILHVYARWYILRNNRSGRRGRTHLVFYVDSASPDAASFPSRGLDPDLLKSLPTFVFSSTVNGAPVEEEKLPECAVCLSEFEDGEKGRVLPKCKHSFHVDCIDMWFHSHTTCPLCRSPVDGEFPAVENGTVEVVVDLAESTRGESTHLELGASSGYCADCRPGPSSSSSFGARRKGLDLVGVSVEIPARTASFRFPSSDELGLSSPAGQGYKSPTSRLLKRILSREKKPIASPTSPGIGTSYSELADIEEGRVETRTSRSQSRATTPR